MTPAATTHPAPAHLTPGPRGRTSVSAAILTPLCRWAVFLAGVALFIAVALVPPSADLERIRATRDQTLALEQHDLRRLAQYRAMSDALVAQDPETLALVLAAELQLVPEHATALVKPGQPADPRLFELLEPTTQATLAAPAAATPSALTRLATDRIGRAALLVLAAAAVLWGCLPPAPINR